MLDGCFTGCLPIMIKAVVAIKLFAARLADDGKLKTCTDAVQMQRCRCGSCVLRRQNGVNGKYREGIYWTNRTLCVRVVWSASLFPLIGGQC